MKNTGQTHFERFWQIFHTVWSKLTFDITKIVEIIHLMGKKTKSLVVSLRLTAENYCDNNVFFSHQLKFPPKHRQNHPR